MTTKADNPAPFPIDAEGIVKLLEEMLPDGYPTELCVLRLTAEPLTEEERAEELPMLAEMAAKRLMQGQNIQSYGMKFLMEVAEDVGLNQDIVYEVLQGICRIHYYQK